MQLRKALEQAIKVGGPQVERLGSAGTSVTFKIARSPKRSVTLLLDRDPPEVADGGEPAEITIELSAKQAERFARGDLALPTRIANGEVSYTGPVRKYLSLDPIIRSMLARVDEK
jgi:hypothetical protein